MENVSFETLIDELKRLNVGKIILNVETNQYF